MSYQAFDNAPVRLDVFSQLCGKYGRAHVERVKALLIAQAEGKRTGV